MGGPDVPSRDPGVYSRPGAASIRPSALWDAVYELAIGNITGITPEGAQGLIDQSIANHEGKPDPHPVYVTYTEGDQRWGLSSGLSAHTHQDATSGGLIDYLRTQWGTDHTAAANPHAQYTMVADVQATVDGAIATHAAAADPHANYLNQARGDQRYGLLVDLGALTTRVTTLEGQVSTLQSDLASALNRIAALEGQLGPGDNGHTHPMGSWRNVGKPILPATRAASEPVAATTR